MLGERRAEHQYGSEPHCLSLKWEQGAASDLLSTEIWRRLLIDEEENGWATQATLSCTVVFRLPGGNSLQLSGIMQ